MFAAENVTPNPFHCYHYVWTLLVAFCMKYSFHHETGAWKIFAKLTRVNAAAWKVCTKMVFVHARLTLLPMGDFYRPITQSALRGGKTKSLDFFHRDIRKKVLKSQEFSVKIFELRAKTQNVKGLTWPCSLPDHVFLGGGKGANKFRWRYPPPPPQGYN